MECGNQGKETKLPNRVVLLGAPCPRGLAYTERVALALVQYSTASSTQFYSIDYPLALAHGLDRPGTLVLMSIGARHCSLALVQQHNGETRLLASAASERVTGDAMDVAVAQLMGVQLTGPVEEQVATARAAARRTKEALSVNQVTESGVTRAAFEQSIAPLVEEFRSLCIRVYTEAGQPHVDAVEVAAGAARVPVLQRVALEVFSVDRVSHHVDTETTALDGAHSMPDELLEPLQVDLPSLIAESEGRLTEGIVNDMLNELHTAHAVQQRLDATAEARNELSQFALETRDNLREWRESEVLFGVLVANDATLDRYLALVERDLEWVESGEGSEVTHPEVVHERLSHLRDAYRRVVGPYDDLASMRQSLDKAEGMAARGKSVAEALRNLPATYSSAKSTVLAAEVLGASSWIEPALAVLAEHEAALRLLAHPSGTGTVPAEELTWLAETSQLWGDNVDRLKDIVHKAEAELDNMQRAQRADAQAREAKEAAAQRAQQAAADRATAAEERMRRDGMPREVTGSAAELSVLIFFGLLFAGGAAYAYYRQRRGGYRRSGGYRLGGNKRKPW